MVLTYAAETDKSIFIDLTNRDKEGGNGQKNIRYIIDGYERDRHTKSNQNENGYGRNEKYKTTSRHIINTANLILDKKKYRNDKQI